MILKDPLRVPLKAPLLNDPLRTLGPDPDPGFEAPKPATQFEVSG